MAHYPYHIGQIVYLGRSFIGKDWESLSIPKAKGASKAFTDTLKKNSAEKE
ncbi:MAG: DUF1572 family protein [Sediminibacterium sp.]